MICILWSNNFYKRGFIFLVMGFDVGKCGLSEEREEELSRLGEIVCEGFESLDFRTREEIEYISFVNVDGVAFSYLAEVVEERLGKKVSVGRCFGREYYNVDLGKLWR